MDQIARRFRLLAPVHLGWTIFVLMLCCVALVTYQPDADKVTNFFGFAATITSLFLGAIAIFYSIIANQGFSSTLGSLQRSSENIRAFGCPVGAVRSTPGGSFDAESGGGGDFSED